MRRAVVVLVVAASLAAILVSAVGAEVRATRVLDRMYSCEAGYIGGLHQVQLSSTYQTVPGSRKLVAVASVTRNMWDSPYGPVTGSEKARFSTVRTCKED